VPQVQRVQPEREVLLLLREQQEQWVLLQPELPE
jgi:hypothetical protein